MPITLRPYQIEAADSVGPGRSAIVLPTGTGKTTVIAELARRTIANGQRVVALAHRTEIVDQIAERIALHTGEPVGIEAAHRRSSLSHKAVVGMVPTLRSTKRLDAIDANVGLVVVDECHHAAANSYQSIMAGLGCFDGVPAVGFTATLSRGDSKRLSDTWERVAYSKDIRWAIEEGYLCPVRGKSVVLRGLDLGGVKRRGGDYVDGELGEAIAAETPAIVRAWTRHGEGRLTMAFVPTVDAATELCEQFVEGGIPAEIVVGTTPPGERDRIYARFRAGQTQVLVSVSVLTEGFDMPSVECVLMARPTQMAHVYVQAVGRGLRPAPGKRDCLVLDVVGVARLHSLATLAELDVDTRYETVTPDGDVLDEETSEGMAIEREVARQHVEHMSEIDLFDASRSIWLHTHNGTRFIPAGDESVFLLPVGDDRYAVGHVGTARGINWGRGAYAGTVSGVDSWEAPWDTAYVMDIDTAREWAEAYATNSGSYSDRTASWRSTKKPSEGQLRMAISLRIQGASEMTRAQLSDAISIVLTSRLLDHV